MKIKKRVFVGLLVSIVLMVAIVVGTQLTVSAAVPGATVANPIVLKSGEWHTKVWTNDNDHLNCYNQITVPSRGYITIVIEKPLDSEGEYGSFSLDLYSSVGETIWATSTSQQKNDFSEYYRYDVGLAAGTYYLNLDPSFYLYSDSAPIRHGYMYQYTKASNWEIEPNGNVLDATEIVTGKTYYGVYTDEAYSVPYNDYFKVKLTKGVEYTWTVGGWDKLDITTTILYVYDKEGSEILATTWGDRGANNTKVTINPTYSGWYYLCLGNAGSRAGVDYTVRVDKHTTPISELKVSLSASSYTYNGKVRVPTVTVKDAKGKTISSSNYTVSRVTGCKNAGTHKIKVTMKGAYSGSKTLSYKIKPISVSKCSVKLSTTKYTYNAKVKTPRVVVKTAGGTTLKKGTHYTVTYASGRKSVGTYKVTVKMKGNYSGSKTLTFKIVPAKVSLTKLGFSGSTVKAYWKAKTSQCSGYQVQCSTSKSFSSYKSKTVTSYKTSSASVSGFSFGKTFYIRVRTYKTAGGTKYYSLWTTYKYSKGKITVVS